MYIGYIGFDSQRIRSLLEHHKVPNKKKLKQKYQLIAKEFFEDGARKEKKLHKWNCKSERFTNQEIDYLIKVCKFKKSYDKTWYEVYYPSKNSSKSYLREIRQELKTIQ